MQYDPTVKSTNKECLQSLMPRHYKILDLAILGHNTAEIAKMVGMGLSQVNVILKSPNFQHQFALRRKVHEEKISTKAAIDLDKTKAILVNNTINAANTLVEGLTSPDSKIKIKSAESILDRTGYPKETKLEGGTNTNIFIDSKQLNIMKETLKMDSNKTEVDLFKITGTND